MKSIGTLLILVCLATPSRAQDGLSELPKPGGATGFSEVSSYFACLSKLNLIGGGANNLGIESLMMGQATKRAKADPVLILPIAGEGAIDGFYVCTERGCTLHNRPSMNFRQVIGKSQDENVTFVELTIQGTPKGAANSVFVKLEENITYPPRTLKSYFVHAMGTDRDLPKINLKDEVRRREESDAINARLGNPTRSVNVRDWSTSGYREADSGKVVRALQNAVMKELDNQYESYRQPLLKINLPHVREARAVIQQCALKGDPKAEKSLNEYSQKFVELEEQMTGRPAEPIAKKRNHDR